MSRDALHVVDDLALDRALAALTESASSATSSPRCSAPTVSSRPASSRTT